MSIFTVPDVGGVGVPGTPGTDSPLPEYGMIYHAAAGSGQAITVGGSPQQLVSPAFLNGPFSGTTPDGANDRLIIDVTGTYVVKLGVSWTFNGGGSLTWRVHNNGAPETRISIQALGFTFYPNSGTAEGILALTAGDLLTVFVSTSANGTVQAQRLQLYAERLDP